MEINLIQIFKLFYKELPDAVKSVFDEYFLGSNTDHSISFDQYVNILSTLLNDRTPGNYRTIKYNRLSLKTNIQENISLYKSPEDYTDSLWIQDDIYNNGKYPSITASNYEYYTGIVFLIHPDVNDKLIKYDSMLNLASLWYDYSVKYILGYIHPTFIYRYASKNSIVHSTIPLPNTTLKKYRIYTNYIFGPKVLIDNDKD